MSLFTNAHWSVVEDGLETIRPLSPYDFAIDRVFETTRRGQEFYFWPVHMAEKTWVDVALFNEAFDFAIHHQSKVSGVTIDNAMLRSSYAQAYIIAASR